MMSRFMASHLALHWNFKTSRDLSIKLLCQGT